jgi:hypothetical protein
MSKKLFRVAVDAAEDAADNLKKPIQMVVEAASDKKAKEAALTAISQNAETSSRTKGKVIVDVEEFNKQPVTEKFKVASPQEVRKVTAAAAGKKSGEMGEAIVQPHKLTVDDVEYDLPAFDPKDPKYQGIGMRSATGEDLFRLGQANMKPQNLTILPNFLEKALSNDANPKMRTLGKWLGVSDDMNKGVAKWANNGGWWGRAYNTGWRTGTAALAAEIPTSLYNGEPDGNGGTRSGKVLGKGMVGQAVGAVVGRLGKSDEERNSEEMDAKKKMAQQAKESRAQLAVKKMSPAGIPSKEAFDINSQSIARAIGDKSENGAMAHRVYEEAIRPMFKSAQGSDDAERISNATRRMFETQSADQIVESLLFKASKAEKDMYQARAQRQTAEGQRPDEFKPVMHDSFKRFLGKFQSDDINTPYITFPTDMTTSYHDGQPRTGFKVTRAYPDSPRGETIFVIPVIVPKKTKAEQNLLGTAAKKGDADVPTMSDRMAEDKYEVIYIDANPKNLRKPEVPRDQIIW